MVSAFRNVRVHEQQWRACVSWCCSDIGVAFTLTKSHPAIASVSSYTIWTRRALCAMRRGAPMGAGGGGRLAVDARGRTE